MASIGSGLSFLVTKARPLTCACSSSPLTTDSGAMPVRWFGITCRSLSNQKFDTLVSTSPLPGIGSGRITSKAESRSVRSEQHTPELQSQFHLLCRLFFNATAPTELYSLPLHDALPI